MGTGTPRSAPQSGSVAELRQMCWLALACAWGACASTHSVSDALPGTAGAPAAAGGGDARSGPRAANAAVAELLALLPPGADRCVLLTPGAIDEAVRPAFALVAHAQAIAFNPALRVQAYARVERRRHGGQHASVTALRSAAPAETVKSVLDGTGGWDLRWRPGPLACSPDECPTRARQVDAHTVVIEQGQWPVGRDARGVERACRQMPAATPGAVEWSASRGQSLAALAGPAMPLRSSRSVRIEAGRLRIQRSYRMPSEVLAAELAAVGSGGGAAELDALERPLGRSHKGAELYRDSGLSLSDLQLRLDDRARLLAARLEARALAAHVPAQSAVDLARRGELPAQIGHRVARLAVATPADKPALAADLEALLRRAVAAYPADALLAKLLAGHLLGVAAAPGQALAVVEPHLRDPVHGEALAGLHREALARSDRAEYAKLLVAEKVVRPALAAGAAEAIADAVAEGTPYAEAEGAWVAWARVVRLARGQSMRATRTTGVPLRSLVEGLLALRHLGGVHEPMQVVLRQPGGGLSTVRVGAGRRRVGEDLLITLEPGDDAAARALGQALSVARLRGHLEVWASTRARGGRAVRLGGELQAGHLRVTHADPVTARLDLPAMGATLWQPLAQSSTGRFVLPVGERARAVRMRRTAATAFGIACEVDAAAHLGCRPGRRGRTRAHALLVALAAERLDRDARRMWAP